MASHFSYLCTIMKSIFSFILSTFFFWSVLMAQQKEAMVKGVVLEDGDPVMNALVYLKEKPSHMVSTDLNGAYRLQIPVGNFTLICSYAGAKKEISIQVEAGAEMKQNFQLESQLLNAVEIATEARALEKSLKATNSVETITAAFLERKNTINVKSALDSKPGINILDGEPQIRGGSGFTLGVGSRVAITVDGVPLLSGDAGQPQWDFVPLENLESVEVIKGASSVLYSSAALSGAIAFTTAYPTLTPKTKLSTNIGMYDAPNDKSAKWWKGFQGFGGVNFLHSRIVGQNLDIIVGGNFTYDMGYIGAPKLNDWVATSSIAQIAIHDYLTENPGKPVPGDYKTNFSDKQMHTQRGRINFNFRYRFAGEKTKGMSIGLAGNAMYNNTNFSLAWFDYGKNAFRAYPLSVFLQKQTMFNIDPYFKYASSSGTVHSVNTRYLFIDNQISNDQSNRSETAYAEYQVKKSVAIMETIAGASFSHTWSRSQIYKGLNANGINYAQNASGYLQMQLKPWERFTWVFGGRLEYFNLNGKDLDVMPIGRTSLNIELFRGSFVRASYGMGYRFPTIAEKYLETGVGVFGVFPNVNLKPELSHNFELGWKQGLKFGDAVMGYIDVAGFHSMYRNTIEYLFGIWKPADRYNLPFAGFKFLNTGNSTVSGIDASFHIQAKLDTQKQHELILMGGYTYLLPLNQNPDEVYANDYSADTEASPLTFSNTSQNKERNYLKYRFLHTFKFDVDYNFKHAQNAWANIAVGLSGRFFGKMENVDKAIGTLETYTQNGIVDESNQQLFPPLVFDEWWKNGNRGNFILDARVAYEFGKKGGRLSLVVNNVLNRQYSLRPLKMESPRTIALQYTITLEHKS